MNLNTLFIEPVGKINPDEQHPASYVRKDFRLISRPAKATLIISACGLYKAFINGKPVTNQQFMPGFTYYTKRLQYQTFDVTDLLVSGENAIGVVLGDGWYRGRIGLESLRNVYGDKIKLMANLTIEFANGDMFKIHTDESWRSIQSGPIRMSDLQDGEIYDARLEIPGWNEPGFDANGWQAMIDSIYNGQLVPSEGEAIFEQETFSPAIINTPDGSIVLDFGQNLFGYVRFNVSGDAGQIVTLQHGEVLDENGNFTLKNLHKGAFPFPPLQQKVIYTLKAGTQTWQPSFTAHGFRYVKLSKWPEVVKPENFIAIAVYSDMKLLGTFECSNSIINQLVHNTLWSQKSNFLDIPTDCPTRERAGWTGDIASFCETGSYLMDTNKFLSKWLKDLALQQSEDGIVPNVVPDVGLPINLDGSAGWADAAVIVPYTLYKMFGNKTVLEEQYDSMCRWILFVEKRARDHSQRAEFAENPYHDYIVDTGYHFGEWLEPGHDMDEDHKKNLVEADAEVATAYFAYSTTLLAKIADVLGRAADARKFSDLAAKVKTAYRHTFTKDGLVESDRQCRYVRPIALDLLPEADKCRTVAALNDMVIANDYKIGTGFLTTPLILSVLTDHGYVDTAYKMAENETRPGWLYAVGKGATTIWEDWNGVDDHGVPKNSHNHYTFGAVIGWYFSRVAGIQPLLPGFKKVSIHPIPGGSLSFAKATYNSPNGFIRSEWRIDSDEFGLTVETPVDAVVTLPDGKIKNIGSGRYHFSSKIL